MDTWVAAELNAGTNGPFPSSDCSSVCGNNVITGPASFCNSANCSITSPGANGTIAWSVNSSNLIGIAGQPGAAQTTAYTKNAGNGSAILTATITTNATCGSNSFNISTPISVITPAIAGTFSVAPSSGPQTNYPLNHSNSWGFPTNTHLTFSIQLTTPRLTNVSWSVSGSYISYSSTPNGLELDVNMVTPSTLQAESVITVTVNATGPCGNVVDHFNFQAVSNSQSYGDNSYVMTHNPSSNSLTITQTDDNTSSIKTTENKRAASKVNAAQSKIIGLDVAPLKAELTQLPGINKVQIFDMAGRLWKTIEGKGTKQLQIDVSNLSSGAYMVEVSSGTNIQQQKIVVQHSVLIKIND